MKVKTGKYSIWVSIIILGLLPSALWGLNQEKVLRFRQISIDQGLSHSSVMGIAKDRYGFMWFATWDGLNRYDGYKIITYAFDGDNPKTIPNNRLRQIYRDHEGFIWASTYDSIFARYNYESDDFSRFKFKQVPKYIVDSLNRDRTLFHTYILKDDYIWKVLQQNNVLGKQKKLSEVNNIITQTNRETNKVYSYRTDLLNPWAISDDFVRSIMLDESGMFWAGTATGGVCVADSWQKQFYTVSQNVKIEDGLIDNKIRAICVDHKQNTWVGTYGKGLTCIDPSGKIFTHFQFNKKDTTHSIVNDLIRHIYADRFGLIWIATKGGLSCYNPVKKSYRNYFATYIPAPGVAPNWICRVMEDSNGYLWVASWGGISKFDRKHNRFYTIHIKTKLKYSSVRDMVEDEKHNFWVATEGGLFYVKRDTTVGFEEHYSIKSYFAEEHNPNSISDNRLYSILYDNHYRLWIANSGGLDCLDTRTGSFTHFSKKNGLPENMVLGILYDSNENIWISHKRGLTKIDTHNSSMRHYSKEDGLQGNEFLEDAYFKDKKTGYFYFGGNNGFTYFLPDSIKINTILPQTRLTSLFIKNKQVQVNEKINGRVILNKPIYLQSQITFTHNDAVIGFEFSALHYSNPRKNQYAYMLEGFDSEWIYTDAQNRLAQYSKLPPGKYLLKVKSANCDGIWNHVPIVLSIEVLPAWWATWWFRTLAVLLCLVILFLMYKKRVHYFQKREVELTRLVKQRTHELEESNMLLMEKNTQIEEQAEELIIINETLKDQKNRLEEQTEEITAYSDNLRNANELLVEKQTLILDQSSALENSNSQLKQLNATKDRFFSIIAHDLRNPFHAIAGFSELLLRRYTKLPAEKIEKFLNLIHASANTASTLLENLLLWSRSQTGSIGFEPALIKLNSVACDTQMFLMGTMQNKAISFTIIVDEDLMVYADENMLKTVLRNLVSNAIKFSNQSGEITFSASENEDYIELSVADKGVGIEADKIDLLFNSATNISTKGTADEVGTGLGLILCKEFVEKHGGTIWVESIVNEGSRFVFTLPRVRGL